MAVSVHDNIALATADVSPSMGRGNAIVLCAQNLKRFQQIYS